ncbi:STAS domain-containing protein [Mycobacterium sp. NPDC051804]|uniref:STAS domain-containing protein n=1 Tax=Mycobacterium sp. NPDC051804 TaxID=3364295 RepID=UPI0037B6416F
MTISTSRVFRPDPESIGKREEHHRGVFTAHRDTPSTVTVVVEGEIDASNSRELAGYVQRHIAGATLVVLDLRLVDFLGTAGFAALHNINVICCGSEATWVLQAGRQVRRLLQICDPDGALPLEQAPLLSLAQ